METKPQPSKLKQTVTTSLLVLTAIAFVFILMGKHDSQKARIAEWATQHGYTAAEIRKAGILEPSPFLLNEEHDDIFRAELEDASHQRRTS